MTATVRIAITFLAALPPLLFGQAPVAGNASAPAPTMKQLMLDLIHPASNEILLAVTRGGPASDAEWATLRHSALTLREAADSLLRQNSAQPWQQSAKMLAGAASDVYSAAQSKNARALNSITIRIDASCTNCHKQYRPNVFPPPEGRVQ